MEKTAVDWLVEQIKQNVHNSFEEFELLVKQAKEMEEAQRKNDFRAGWHGNKHKDWNCEFYLIKHIANDFKTN